MKDKTINYIQIFIMFVGAILFLSISNYYVEYYISLIPYVFGVFWFSISIVLLLHEVST